MIAFHEKLGAFGASGGKIRTWALAVASVLVAVMLGGCPTPSCPTLPHTDPDQALGALRSMRRPVRSLRAEARVEQRGAEGRIRGTVMMFVELPDRVRFDAMTQFGPAAVLTSDGERFALSDLREKRYLYGPSCPDNIARLIGIPMSGRRVARLLVGDTPLIEAEQEGIQCTDRGTYLVTRDAPDGRVQEVELGIRNVDRDRPPSQQHLRLKRSEVLDRDGNTLWRVSFEEHRVVPDPRSEADPAMGVAMPFRVHYVNRPRDAEVLVRFRSIDLNADVPSGAFEQSPRPGMTLEEVQCEPDPSREPGSEPVAVRPATPALLQSARDG